MTEKKTQITIDRLALDGDGIGRLSNGQAAFVPYSLSHEIIDSRLLIAKKNHSRWLPESVVKPSPDRVVPACRYHFKPGAGALWCGGCDWQHISVSMQRQAKRQLVIETLTRLGGLENPPVAETVSSPSEWRYRNKVQVPFGTRGKKVIAGFYAPGSHEIVEFDDCLIQPAFSVAIVQFVKQYANDHGWPVYEEDRRTGWIRHLIIRTNEKNEALMALVTANPEFRQKDSFLAAVRKAFPGIVGIHQNIQPAKTNVILGNRWISLWGKNRIQEQILDLHLHYSPGSFFQINRGAAEKLYQKAIDELGADSSATVLDLYCGVGAMTLMAARRSAEAFGVEPVRSAIQDARENAERNGIGNVKFLEMDAEEFFRPSSSHIEMMKMKNLLVIVDPPRSGCTPPVLDGLLRLRPKRMVYVSCHPATLARDLKFLSSSYRVESVTPVDLFPQTSHIEVVARLELKREIP